VRNRSARKTRAEIELYFPDGKVVPIHLGNCLSLVDRNLKFLPEQNGQTAARSQGGWIFSCTINIKGLVALRKGLNRSRQINRENILPGSGIRGRAARNLRLLCRSKTEFSACITIH
jgi:hypothetical protein